MKNYMMYTIFISAILGLISFFLNFSKGETSQKISRKLFFIAWIGAISIFIENWIEANSPPFGNMFHVKIIVAVAFFPFYLILQKKFKEIRLLPFFSVATVIFLVGAFFTWKPGVWEKPPVLNSDFFIPHVLCYMLGYALATVAFIVTISNFRSKRNELEQFSYQVLLYSFPFMTAGLALGTLWAEDAWGQYWSWDIKETWALITWLCYAIYFHCRKTPSCQKIAKPMQIIAFIALVITFIAVNFLPKLASSLHSYAN